MLFSGDLICLLYQALSFLWNSGGCVFSRHRSIEGYAFFFRSLFPPSLFSVRMMPWLLDLYQVPLVLFCCGFSGSGVFLAFWVVTDGLKSHLDGMFKSGSCAYWVSINLNYGSKNCFFVCGSDIHNSHSGGDLLRVLKWWWIGDCSLFLCSSSSSIIVVVLVSFIYFSCTNQVIVTLMIYVPRLVCLAHYVLPRFDGLNPVSSGYLSGSVRHSLVYPALSGVSGSLRFFSGFVLFRR